MEWGAAVKAFANALRAIMSLGPGRALAQVMFDVSPSGEAGLSGSPSSWQFQLGYLFTVR